MAIYVFKAVDNQGRTIEEHREAADEQHLIQTLQSEGLIPIKVSPVSNNFFYLLKFGKTRSTLTQKQIGLFTRELATLLSAGLPLDKSLTVLLDLTEDSEILTRVINDVLEKVKGGSTLADALQNQTNTFSRFYLNMIRAGELGGNLEEVLARLSEYLESSSELKDTVATALIYPAILLIMSLASLFVMLTFVVPQFSEMFDNAGKELPLSTQFVVGLAEFLKSYWWALLALCIALAAYLNYQLIDPVRKKIMDKRLLALPLAGDIILNMETANMSRTMGTLLANGVSIITALTIVQETITNLQLAEAVSEATEKLKQGGNMSDALLASERFPKLALQMMKMGEETGRLEEMLLKVANIYDKQLRVAIQRMLALLEPALIISMGVMIAGIIASILLAILSVNDLAF
jgi:general secretion pathway protein F